MGVMKAFVNLLLIAACGYLMYSVQVDKPYAFAAGTVGLCYGLLFLLSSYCDTGEEDDEESENCPLIGDIADSLLELLPMPLLNMELYGSSGQSNLTYIHLISFFPVVLDGIAKLFCQCGKDKNVDSLKGISLFCNICSLIYLGVMEEKYMYCAVAVPMIITRYAGFIMRKVGLSSSLQCGSALFFVAAALVFQEGGSGGE